MLATAGSQIQMWPPGGSIGLDPTMVLVVIISSHIGLLLTTLVSSSASLHCAHIFLSLSSPFLHHLLDLLSDVRSLGASGVILGVVSGVLCPTCAFLHHAGSISGMVCAPQVCEAPDWWSTQASSLSLMVVLGLLLVWACLWPHWGIDCLGLTPAEGSWSQVGFSSLQLTPCSGSRSRPVQCWTRGHHRLAPCTGPVASYW